jgi:NCAIR mutase (PurE)-related protein
MVGTRSFDTVLGLCRNQRQRIVLAVLAEEQRSLTVNDLTKTILKYNHQAPVTEVSEEVMTQIQRSLHHVHLPKLASAGVIEYDTERHLVEPADNFVDRVPYLPAILDTDPNLQRPVEL